MKVDTIISLLEGLESWLKRNGFPGAKPAVIAVHEAIKLLKEQEPIEPIPPEDETDLWRCGYCKKQILRCTHQRFCSECGRRVLWKW